MKAERLYCNSCGWVSPEQNIGMKNACPECNKPLYVRFEKPNDEGVELNSIDLPAWLRLTRDIK